MEKVIERAIDDLTKKYGKSFFGKADEVVPAISSGSIALDCATKLPGLPRGRIIEYFGLESSGKSTMALRAVGAAQEAGEYCAWIDAEQAFEPMWAKRHGVFLENDGGPKDLRIVYPEYGEQAFDAVDELARTCKFSIIVIDSVAALLPKSEMEADMGDQQMGTQSRMISQALRKLNPSLAKTNTTLILINQLRQKIGVMFGNPYTTPGGLAIKFYSSVRVDFRSKKLKKGDKEIGIDINFKIIKNKVGAPHHEGSTQLLYGYGIDEANEIAEMSVTKGIVTFEGRRYSLDGNEIAVGIEEFKDKIRTDVALRADIKNRLIEFTKAEAAPSPEIPPETEPKDEETEPVEARRGRRK
jgi:recombination protein RecA